MKDSIVGIRDLSRRLRDIPASYGVDGGDIYLLADMAARLSVAAGSVPAPFESDRTRAAIEPVRKILALGVSIQATGEITDDVVRGMLQACIDHIDELEADFAALRGVAAYAAAGKTDRICEVCGGDCSAANPRPTYCPERDGSAAKDQLLALYREAVRIDVKMEGPAFMGCNTSALRRAWEADLAAVPRPREVSARTIDAPQVGEWTVLANARRICATRHKKQPNWVLAMEAFGLGSTWAWALCERIGVDPDARTMAPRSKPSKVLENGDAGLADANSKKAPTP